MRKKREADIEGKNFSDKDNRLLVLIQNILFSEMAIALNTTSDEIYEKVSSLIKENEC